jgi:hypothetical protein
MSFKLGITEHERPLAVGLLGLTYGVYGQLARVAVGDRTETRKVRKEWRFGGFVRESGTMLPEVRRLVINTVIQL